MSFAQQAVHCCWVNLTSGWPDRGSLCLDLEIGHDPAELADLAVHTGAKFHGRVGLWATTPVDEALFDSRLVKHSTEFTVEPIDDRLRCAFGARDAQPRIEHHPPEKCPPQKARLAGRSDLLARWWRVRVHGCP